MLILFEYVRWRPKRVASDTFREWLDGLDDRAYGMMYQKLLALQSASPETFQNLAEGPIKEGGTKYPHIYKLRVSKRVAMRPMLCRGPVQGPSHDQEVCFLVGAFERNGRLEPSPKAATDRRATIIADSDRRRTFIPKPRAAKWTN